MSVSSPHSPSVAPTGSSSIIPCCAEQYEYDELELGNIGDLTNVDDKYPLWRCHLTRMTLYRRVQHFFDWIEAFTVKLDETDSSSKADVISLLRIFVDAGSSKMMDAHSSMNCHIKRYGEGRCDYHTGNPPPMVQEGPSNAITACIHLE
ncbi:hypothetical protein OC842_006422 [Tilletia horrida]|uniref:Uncharacterized protein n=1 Tax=Tilletia horrida TaxID=155126 RepID=A0AAN6G638_9BASI|nr:hypothetical protein OC842_006422 [Tilletia horrida]